MYPMARTGLTNPQDPSQIEQAPSPPHRSDLRPHFLASQSLNEDRPSLMFDPLLIPRLYQDGRLTIPQITMKALRLSNLPPTIKPSHFTYILSRSRRGSPGSADPGIRMYVRAPRRYDTKRDMLIARVEIYTVPKKKNQTLFRHFHLKASRHSPTADTADIPKLSIPSSSSNPEVLSRSPSMLRQSDLQNQEDQAEIPISFEEAKPQDEKEETIAYIHFRTDYHSLLLLDVR
jgi:hypothetical protein